MTTRIVLFCTCIFATILQADTGRQIAIVKEVEDALKSNRPFEKIINLRFFGSYAGMDGYFDQMNKKICVSGKEHIDLFFNQRSRFPQSKKALMALTSIRNKLHDLPYDLQRSLKTSWSYQKLLTDLGKLDCIIQEADRLYQTDDYMLGQKAKKLFMILEGYDITESRLKEIKKQEEKFARESKSKWAAIQSEADSVANFEIMGISPGMSYPDILVFQPDVELINDARGSSSTPQLELKLSEKLRTGNHVEVSIYLGGTPNAESNVVYDIRYSLDLAGLKTRAYRKVIDKLFTKYRRPTRDFTSQSARKFDYNEFLIQLRSQYDKKLFYCWGDCQPADTAVKASGQNWAPGVRLIMNFDKEKNQERLDLRLYDNRQQAAFDGSDLKDEFDPASLFIEDERDSLEF